MAGKTLVRMLTAMAGDAFSYAHGDVVEVDDAHAKAWTEAGLAEPAPKAAASEKAAKDLTARVADLEAAIQATTAERDALKAETERQAAEIAGLRAQASA